MISFHESVDLTFFSLVITFIFYLLTFTCYIFGSSASWFSSWNCFKFSLFWIMILEEEYCFRMTFMETMISVYCTSIGFPTFPISSFSLTLFDLLSQWKSSSFALFSRILIFFSSLIISLNFIYVAHRVLSNIDFFASFYGKEETREKNKITTKLTLSVNFEEEGEER